jgi:5'-3' exonuclease
MSYSKILNNLKETPPPGLNDRILIIDAMNTLIRSFSLLKAMNPSGNHVGGLVGFLRSLGYVTRIFDPTRVIIVWDGKGGSGNRKNINPEYKAQRATSRITHWGLYDTKEEETEALIGQLYRTQDYLECLPVHQIVIDKLEADDIIAYLAKTASRGNVKKCTIVSSDKDFLQLIDDTVEVYAPVKKKTFTKDNVNEEIGVHPSNYNIVKALTGDNSDNLRGIKGLGIKTIVKEWENIVSDPTFTLNDIYTLCESKLEEKKVFAKIIHEWDLIETNYKIMNLHETVLDDREKSHILSVLKSPVPDLQTGAFLHLLDQDKIEGITKNTEGWLDNFRRLTVVK